MATLTRPTDQDLDAIAAAYGWRSRPKLVPVPAGSVNSNYWLEHAETRIFLRIYEQQGAEGAVREWRFLEKLRSRGLRAPRRLPPLNEAALSVQGKVAALFEAIEGEELCLKQVRRTHLERVATDMATWHSLDADWLGQGRFTPTHMLELATQLVAHPRLSSEIKGDLAQLQKAFTKLTWLYDGQLPQAPIHGDLWRDNVRWSAGNEPAYLDWESAHLGPRLLDPAVVIIAWTFADDFDWDKAAALMRSYVTQCPLTALEQDALDDIFSFAALRFAVTRISDFHLNAGQGGAPPRSYTRLLDRQTRLEALGPGGLRRQLGL